MFGIESDHHGNRSEFQFRVDKVERGEESIGLARTLVENICQFESEGLGTRL